MNSEACIQQRMNRVQKINLKFNSMTGFFDDFQQLATNRVGDISINFGNAELDALNMLCTNIYNKSLHLRHIKIRTVSVDFGNSTYIKLKCELIRELFKKSIPNYLQNEVWLDLIIYHPPSKPEIEDSTKYLVDVLKSTQMKVSRVYVKFICQGIWGHLFPILMIEDSMSKSLILDYLICHLVIFNKRYALTNLEIDNLLSCLSSSLKQKHTRNRIKQLDFSIIHECWYGYTFGSESNEHNNSQNKDNYKHDEDHNGDKERFQIKKNVLNMTMDELESVHALDYLVNKHHDSKNQILHLNTESIIAEEASVERSHNGHGNNNNETRNIIIDISPKDISPNFSSLSREKPPASALIPVFNTHTSFHRKDNFSFGCPVHIYNRNNNNNWNNHNGDNNSMSIQDNAQLFIGGSGKQKLTPEENNKDNGDNNIDSEQERKEEEKQEEKREEEKQDMIQTSSENIFRLSNHGISSPNAERTPRDYNSFHGQMNRFDGYYDNSEHLETETDEVNITEHAYCESQTTRVHIDESRAIPTSVRELIIIDGDDDTLMKDLYLSKLCFTELSNESELIANNNGCPTNKVGYNPNTGDRNCIKTQKNDKNLKYINDEKNLKNNHINSNINSTDLYRIQNPAATKTIDYTMHPWYLHPDDQVSIIPNASYLILQGKRYNIKFSVYVTTHKNAYMYTASQINKWYDTKQGSRIKTTNGVYITNSDESHAILFEQ